MYIYINTYRDLDTYTGFFHVDYLGITTSGCNISIFVYSKLPVPQYVVTEVYETKLIMCASSHRTLLTDLYRRLEC